LRALTAPGVDRGDLIRPGKGARIVAGAILVGFGMI
jgi:hypothetical protein